jgi:hypothetical protein
MVRIAITIEAYQAIIATLPFGSVAAEPPLDATEVTIGLEEVWVDRLTAMRWPGEDYSTAILRILATRPRPTP